MKTQFLHVSYPLRETLMGSISGLTAAEQSNCCMSVILCVFVENSVTIFDAFR